MGFNGDTIGLVPILTNQKTQFFRKQIHELFPWCLLFHLYSTCCDVPVCIVRSQVPKEFCTRICTL